MKQPSLAELWEAHLRILSSATAKREWIKDPAFAEAVMDGIRHDVLPLVRKLEEMRVIDWHSFLIHDAPEGSTDPNALYIHLRVSLVHDLLGADTFRSRAIDAGWECVQPIVAPECREIAGLKRDWFLDSDITRAWHVIGLQSEWLLTLIEQHAPSVSTRDLLNHVVQFKHYFANMTATPEIIPDWFESANPPKNAYWIRLRRAARAFAGAVFGKRWS